MKYKEEYINYMIEKISTLNLKHFDIVKESLENLKTTEVDSIGKKLRPIHYHYFKDHKLDFIDYYNYVRCRELDFEIK
jgi:hypothetical protein